MADEIEILPPPKSSGAKTTDVEILPPPKAAEGPGFVSSAKQAARGTMEALPFYGEALAEKAGLPKPTTFPERLTRRAARNLPYALAAGATGVGAVPATLGFVGATGLGQLAEELGVPESYQPVAEIVGGGVPHFARDVAGRTMGYIQKDLAELTKKASQFGYELGPSARAEQGMKYGAGETPQANIRNLNMFTEEATTRAGNPAQRIDGAWIEKTGKKLGNEVNQIFAGKTFQSNQNFVNNVDDIIARGESVFGERGNIAKTIIEKNLGGRRAGGALLDPTFKAEDLRGAITDVNAALSNASGPSANLLHRLKDSLEDLAKYNLEVVYQSPDLAKKYEDWRKAYNSYSSIRDVYQLEGRSGVTAAGQINPAKLLDEIDRRTGGAATRSPLYQNLAEFGQILRVKAEQAPGLIRASTEYFTQSPLAKALKTAIQPYVRPKSADIAGKAQVVAPASQYIQAAPAKDESQMRERKRTGGQ